MAHEPQTTPLLVVTIEVRNDNMTSTRIQVRGAGSMASAMRMATVARDALDAEIADAVRCPVHTAGLQQ